jgi:hypothetical protein
VKPANLLGPRVSKSVGACGALSSVSGRLSLASVMLRFRFVVADRRDLGAGEQGHGGQIENGVVAGDLDGRTRASGSRDIDELRLFCALLQSGTGRNDGLAPVAIGERSNAILLSPPFRRASLRIRRIGFMNCRHETGARAKKPRWLWRRDRLDPPPLRTSAELTEVEHCSSFQVRTSGSGGVRRSDIKQFLPPDSCERPREIRQKSA